MFTDLEQERLPTLTIIYSGQPRQVPAGISVAAALLSLGENHFRDTLTTGLPRAPFCMIGVCFDCLCEINGVANRRACMTEVAEGMIVERQSGVVQRNPFGLSAEGSGGE